METLPRTQFVLVANLVWFAQFVAEFLVVLAPDAVAWRQRGANSLQVGCVGDTAAYVVLDRLYLLTLAWLLTAPLMTVIALRFPAIWPMRAAIPWWNNAAPSASLITLLIALALMAWPVSAALSTPVTSVILVETVRALPLLVIALFYRGVLLA
jgi:hypothetical protein